MTKLVNLVFLIVFGAASALFAQESPAPTATPPPTPSVSSARNVPLRFVPPPMEGTITLGIFDSNDKLIRVLHREAKIDNFTIDENSLKTTWDGKNDGGEDLPSGKYRARGSGSHEKSPIARLREQEFASELFENAICNFV